MNWAEEFRLARVRMDREAAARAAGEPVVRVALAICESREDAEDVAQDSLAKIAMNLELYRPSNPGGPGPWINSIVRNTWRDVCRKRQREAQILKVYQDTVLLRAYESRPDKLAEAAEMNQQLSNALLRLSPMERDCVLQRFYFETSHKDIAAHFGLSRKRERTLFAKALEAIGKNYGRE